MEESKKELPRLLSKTEVADMVGLTPQAIQHWHNHGFRGRAKLPRHLVDEIRCWPSEYGVHGDDVLDFVDRNSRKADYCILADDLEAFLEKIGMRLDVDPVEVMLDIWRKRPTISQQEMVVALRQHGIDISRSKVSYTIRKLTEAGRVRRNQAKEIEVLG